MNDLGFSGFYINLDRRPDRCAGAEAEFARHNLSHAYSRFTAIDGNKLGMAGPLTDGQKGCFASHFLLLKENLEKDRHLHIVEDDVLFGPATEQGLRLALDKGWIDDYDILFTDTYIPVYKEGFQSYKALYDSTVQRNAEGNITGVAFGVADLRHKAFASTNSYLVNRHSIRKLHDIYAAEVARGPQMPIDLFIRDLCDKGLIKAGLIFPFITATRIEHSLLTDIGSAEGKLSLLAGEVARTSFFIGSDWNKCAEYVRTYLPLPVPAKDKHAEILGHILSYFAAEGMKK